MRLDSCRSCGEIMKEFQRCDICNEVNKLVCKRCNKASDEQVHSRCATQGKDLILN